MRFRFGLFLLLIVCATSAFAQESAPTLPPPPPAPQKRTKEKPPFPKFELSGGYAYRSWTGAPSSKIWFNGWFSSFDYNLNRYFGAEGEGSGVYYSNSNISSYAFGSTNIYSLLGGLKVYPLGHRKVTVFGHVLYGIARFSNTTPPYGGGIGTATTSSVGSWEGGGGIDWYFSRHWGARIFQYDFGGSDFLKAKNGGFSRLTAGIVYRWGAK